MKTLQERSEQMVNVKKAGDRAYLMIQVRETAVVLKDVPCSDPGAWQSLQQEADSVRLMLHAALVDYAEELFSEKVVDRLSSGAQAIAPTQPTNVADKRNSKSDSSMQPGVGAPRRNDKILYGLPCPQCGAYFDSELTSCPFCSQRSTEFGALPAEQESRRETITLQ